MTTIVRWAVLAGMVLSCAALAVWASVDIGYDAQADFSQYKTYGWGTGGWEAPNLTTEKRIRLAVEQQLEAKGLKKVDADPDLVVVTYAASNTDERVDAPSFAGLPNTWTGWSVATTSRGSFNGSLKVDLVDRRTNTMVWNGRAFANLGLNPNPEKTGKKVMKVVAEMFEKYPPPVKKK